MVANVTITPNEKASKSNGPTVINPAANKEKPPIFIKKRPHSDNKNICHSPYKASSKNNLRAYASDVPQQYEFDGYVNGKYGHFFVEKTNGQRVVGYWFDKKGNKKNINGEWVRNNLQIYETSGKRSVVLVNDSDKQADGDPRKNDSQSLVGDKKVHYHHILLKD